MFKVCIDAGHGGQDSGAVGVAQGYFESHAVLDIALDVRDILRPHVDVIMTREDDTFVSLPERCRVANSADVDAFVSLHLNSATSRSASGVEVFTSGSTGSKKLAESLLKSHTETFKQQKNRGVKKEAFYVITRSDAPAALWEGCFLSNMDESEWVGNDSTRMQMAQAVADGILAYFNIEAHVESQRLTLEQRVERIEKHLNL